ncbi:MAG: hypothetical protein H7175_03885 [Burkholderiales bacterium]|nr:hypothetical protein [Anaerolineae bacterium]
MLINPLETQVMQLLDEIGDELRERGVALEELMRDGRELRGDLLRELYGIEPEDD